VEREFHKPRKNSTKSSILARILGDDFGGAFWLAIPGW
jgi:hypothetical protein